MVQVKENVYCDKKLVTCAEYQLFLDDQRAVGKYHQPDHWPQAQFALERALMPVVGVRPSDAQTFCSWLTERKQGLWKYRLPKRGEIPSEQVLPLPGWKIPVGYWVDEGQTTVWIPVNGSYEGTSQQDQISVVTPFNLDLNHTDEFASSTKLMEDDTYLHLLVDYCSSPEKLARTLARSDDLT